MKTYETTTNDFVTYAFYFVNGSLELSEIHLLRGEEVNPIRSGFEYQNGAIKNYKVNTYNEL